MGEELALGLAALAVLAGIGAQDAAAGHEPRTVRVVVRQELADGETPIPGVRVLVGCSAGAPTLAPPDANLALAAATLDESGWAEVELEVPTDADAPTFWAEVASDGYQRALTWRREDAKGNPFLELPVRRGGTLFGALDTRSAAESPSRWTRARVRLVPAAATDAESWTSTDELGRFRLHFAERGRYHVHASWDGRGGAVLRDLDLEPDAPPREAALELAAGLELAGRVVDPDGEPVYPLTVSALPEGLEPSAPSSHAWRDGHYGERAVTGPDGAFVLSRLPPGRYTLFGAFDGGAPARLSDAPVSAGSRDGLGVARVHRVALRVRDHEGRARDLGLGSIEPYRRQAGEPFLYCRVGAESAWTDTTLATPRFLAGAEAIEPVEPGDEVTVAYVAANVPLARRELRVPERPWLVREELRLAPPVEPAALRLRVTCMQRPFREHCELSLFAPSGVDVVAARSIVPSELRLRVSPGTYRLRLTPPRGVFCWLGDPEELVPEFAPVEADVTLESGKETDLDLVVRKNARVAVELALPARGTAEEIEAALHTPDFREPLRHALGGAVLELRGADGTVLRPEFSVTVPERAERRRLLAPWIAPGRACVSVTGIAPGDYRALVVLDDGRRLEGEVRLEEARTSTLRLGP